MKTLIFIGDKVRLTEEAIDLLRENPERALLVEDIFEDDGSKILALVLPEEPS